MFHYINGTGLHVLNLYTFEKNVHCEIEVIHNFKFYIENAKPK
jgi:hypothetical protein